MKGGIASVAAFGIGWATLAAADPTPQQQFEAASAALSAGDAASALAGFRAIQQRSGVSSRTRAIAELRAGMALDRLSRPAESASALRHALDQLPASDASLLGDRLDALLALGGQEEDDLDFATARVDFASAMALAAEPLDKVRTRLALARVTLFVDPERAGGLAGEALALAASAPELKPQDRAQIRTLRGRALLNAGRPQEALAELKASVAELGGLSLKVDRADLVARSDLAIAAIQAGDAGEARKYLAYTGSGVMNDNLPRGIDMDPPACGDEGLKPDDVAVVQFGIGDGGEVLHPQPIYSSARGDRALLFPRAVAGWSWAAASVKAIPPLFRSVLRVEVRCSTTVPRPGIAAYLREAVNRWIADKGLEAASVEAASSASALPLLRQELTRREAGPDPVRQLPVLLALADNPLTDNKESEGWIDRASALADRAGAPPLVRAAMRMRLLSLQASNNHRSEEARVADLRQVADDPTFAADARTAAAVRLVIAEGLSDMRRRAAAMPYLAQVDADERLSRTDPLRQAAAARLASLQVAAGQVEAARQTFSRSGETAEQCALVDAAPVHTRGTASERDYPDAAREWGFSGWTADEFDILADGTPANVRTIVAYPPFVFGPAVEGFVKRTRYTQSFRPDGQAGCGGYRASLAFRYVRNR